MKHRIVLLMNILKLIVVVSVHCHDIQSNAKFKEKTVRTPVDLDHSYTESEYKAMIKYSLKLSLAKYNNYPSLQGTYHQDNVRQEVNNKTGYDVKFIENNVFILEETTKTLQDITGVPFVELQRSNSFKKAFKDVMYKYCPTTEWNCDAEAKYRTIDGSCNNLIHPEWGRSYTSKPRYLSPVYEDGLKSPRRYGIKGEELPGAREISNVMMKATSAPILEDGLTLMVMAWGQFLTHDMTFTMTTTDIKSLDLDCCNTSVKSDQCFSIPVPDNDKYFNSTCMSFTRASPGPYPLSCTRSEREQINMQTSFIDASNVYGATKDRLDELRSKLDGQMKLSFGDLPPKDPNIHSCLVHKKDNYCLRAGDDRINVLPHLQAFHTLFLREHNRVAKTLANINMHWKDEQIFQETRKIIGSFFQHITFKEYLPNILSEQYQSQLSSEMNDIYDDTVNPSIRNAFATAGFRFGHSQVPRIMAYMRSNFTYGGKFDVKDSYGNPEIVEKRHGQNIPGFFRWLSTDLLYKVDRIFEASVRNHLFFQDGRSFDLAAINIQRGREQGLPVYNEWRNFCGLPQVQHFNVSQGGLINHNQKTARLLSTLYSDAQDIDLYVGGVSEQHMQGSIIGPTFACIILKQFKALKKGDRFWYERQGLLTAFKPDQLQEIKKIKLSTILCNNLKMEKIQPNVFQTISQKNKLQSCDSLMQIDLTKWKEEISDVKP